MTSTSPVSPGTSIVPSTCGNGRRTSTTAVTRPATSTSTSATTPYAVQRAARGQSRKTCHGIRSGSREFGWVMVVLSVPYHWQSPA